MKVNILSFLLSLYICSFFGKAWALNTRPASRTINEKSFHVAIKSSFFNTTGTFDDSGSSYSLAGGESFRKDDYSLFLKYGFSRDLEVFGDVIVRNNSSQTSTAQKKIMGAESFSLGTKYQMRPLGSWGFGWEAYYRKTLYSNSPSLAPTQELALGDHGQEVAVHFIGSFQPFSRQYFSFLVGYKRPPNELSSEIPYLFESVFTGSSWTFSLGVLGNFSLKQDLYSGDPQNKPLLEVAANSPSELFNSVNKRVLKGFGTFRKEFGKWGIDIGYGKILSGFSTDVGWQLDFSLSWQGHGLTKKRRKRERFKEYEVDALITKVSPRGGFVKLDKGYADAIEKGMSMDIYQTDYKGKNVLVATGVIFESKANWSILKITKKYIEGRIQVGFIARGME